ncbi:MAG: crossover junction endodeoxyribonuclease RuvC [Acidibacillus sp.]|uniref:Crossover junction endodeoxyribonuclease RuvC n=1 Tax=Sulfoacidibacillus ferrooxidans TaxID=2005001 RepID=A0A9X1V630_9BACL|nr:crossover junction endodeoxyribonuclease RuvC [Sulfoacidibacillus ferrooxidans]MCI0182028.1 Crossover junction endodeoxyribonuclease RuvC [Sulfoacidibacillus ferrooxidans]MCY0892404.1 crossover junction endodeoxyribonuclease RuvC [Acidibacillus sp.]
MRILGIDPGFGRTGYAVIETGQSLKAIEYGCIETLPHTPNGSRFRDIFEAVTDVIERHRPDVAAIEQLFFNRNVTTAFTASEARGVVVLAAELASIQQFSYTPLQVKMAVVGYGRADKKQVQEMVRVLLKLPTLPKPDDAADALAIAITHAHSYRMAGRVDGGGRTVRGEVQR